MKGEKFLVVGVHLCVPVVKSAFYFASGGSSGLTKGLNPFRIAVI
jgi:hypothetical protein